MLWLLVACSVGVSPETGFISFDTGRPCFDTGGGTLRYADVDGDGYGDEDAALARCDAPEGFVAQGGDCNDASATQHPGATERCGDGVDQDCDGVDPAC